MPTALRQLEDALEYLSERSPSAASRLLDDAFAAGDSLETMGERGREVPEIRDGRTRELLVQRYRLMYEVSDSGIDIVAFVHGPRLRPPASPTIARRAPRPANRDPNARPE